MSKESSNMQSFVMCTISMKTASMSCRSPETLEETNFVRHVQRLLHSTSSKWRRSFRADQTSRTHSSKKNHSPVMTRHLSTGRRSQKTPRNNNYKNTQSFSHARRTRDRPSQINRRHSTTGRELTMCSFARGPRAPRPPHVPTFGWNSRRGTLWKKYLSWARIEGYVTWGHNIRSRASVRSRRGGWVVAFVR